MVQDIEHQWIPMADGVRLAARLWLPDTAQQHPVPAILEIIPYRKRDMVRPRDERNHPYFAAHGYACLRVDMRGSGDSEGLMADMYSDAELDDTRQVIDWIAAQPWCNGRVGMFGTSWGGTASLQASIDPPHALRAVIAVCATHDRYEDDIHHKGGLLLTDSIEWGATLPVILASPPASTTVGDDWWSLWQHRLANLSFPLDPWVQEETRGDYWRRGSVRFQSEHIGCPILAVGGWADRYSHSVMALSSARPDRVWGVVGPWGHHYPDVGHPGPAMGFQQLALAWWDHWLGSDDPTPLNWPRLRVWLREFDPPGDVLERRHGDWMQSDVPEQASEPQVFFASEGVLSQQPSPTTGPDQLVPDDLRVGLAAGDTGYFGRFGGLPLDQAIDDVHALVFETPPLDKTHILFGVAELTLDLSMAQYPAQLSLRISDVAPDGQVNRVVLALRNLALDDSLEQPLDLPPEAPRRVQVRFPSKAYRFAPGHRIRLALASSYWPLAWPAPQPSGIRIRHGSAQLSLPLLRESPQPLAEPLPKALDLPQIKNHHTLAAPRLLRQQHRDADGRQVSSWHQPPVRVETLASGEVFEYETRAEHAIHPANPLSASSAFEHRLRMERQDGIAEVYGWAKLEGEASAFLLQGGVRVFWEGEEIFQRDWSRRVSRRIS